MSEGSCVGFMERLKAGEVAAARAVFERYTRQLVGLARRRLDERLAAKSLTGGGLGARGV